MISHPVRPEPVEGRPGAAARRGLALATALALAACGVKGPPRPPGAKDPAADRTAPAAPASPGAAGAGAPPPAACEAGCGAPVETAEQRKP